MPGDAVMNDNIEQKKLELEKRRLEFEIEKQKDQIKLERIKTLGILIPLVLVVITFMVDNYEKNQDYQNELLMKKIDSNNSFKLQAAQIVMNAESPRASYNRARVLQALFPYYLNSSFPERFDPAMFGTPAKMDLAKLIIDHPMQRNEIIDLWISIYPGDAEWANKWRTIYNITWASGESGGESSAGAVNYKFH